MTKFDESRGKVMELMDDIFMLGIEAGFNHGVEVCKQKDYKRGYDAGLDKIQERVDDAYGVGYRHGLDDAWECMRKLLFLTPQERGKMLDCEGATIQEVFDYSAEEAIAKVKENESKVTKKYCAECGQLRITDEGRCILGYKDLCHEKDKWIPEQDTDNIEVAYDEETRSYIYTIGSSSENPNK